MRDFCRLPFLYPLFVLFILTGCGRSGLFEEVHSGRTGIHFNNIVLEDDSINPIDLEFLYNGGGVSVGDFNRDGKPDLYFTGSRVPCRMYLNQGDFRFSDITEKAGVDGDGRWVNGAAVIDINNDGWQDLYLCATIWKDPAKRKNLLYINQGLDKSGVPTFTEMAAQYQLTDTGFSVQAAFLDYDLDGDLDMYLLTTRLAQRDAVQLGAPRTDSVQMDVDRLFRNDWSDSLKHPVFTDVSAAAGIREKGFGLGLAVQDINGDGWPDVYATNDFYSNDLLYINNRDGTFTNKAGQYLKHTSQNAMGNDVADINNDGLPDILAVDMNPADNFRKKKNMNGNNYYVYQSMMRGEVSLQYVRNTLQLNQGRIPSDSSDDVVFSDIGFLSGVAETDWSWNPSLADFDNDGWRDIIITNGYPRDVTDHDFSAFRVELSKLVTKKELIEQIPQIKIANYAYRNKGDLSFEDVTKSWGLSKPSFSNGAAYADLDGDGDLDYVINNINEEAFVYENTLNDPDRINGNYLHIDFRGDRYNLSGIGAFAEIHYNGTMQVYENYPCRGYLSYVSPSAFFGLGKTARIDSLVVRWPGGKRQVMKNVQANQHLQVDIRNASLPAKRDEPAAVNRIFSDITQEAGIDYRHEERDFIDFNIQRLLPHKLSQYGPGLATGDLDGNGLDDIVIGGSGKIAPAILLQQADGKFRENKQALRGDTGRSPENMGILVFDADGDGDLDVYFANGSNEFTPGSKAYQDRMYANDGRGNFVLAAGAMPANTTSKSCVKAGDFDNDGDLDLFIGGRVIPERYPEPPGSILLRNDSRAGTIIFTDVTASVAPELLRLGMVCDALWSDYDNDGWTDLVIAGEWMPVTFFKNNHGRLRNSTTSSGVEKYTGWWNSITGGDFDNDGDIDYVVGNLGQNAFYKASDTYPVSIYAKDFDKNQNLDAVPAIYLPDEEGKPDEFPVHTRDDIVEQLPALKKKYLTYRNFANARIKDLFPGKDLDSALVVRANHLSSSYLENAGQGRFKMTSLPIAAQVAPLYGMIAEDYNADGYLDLAVCGNDFGTEVSNGRYDALNGLVLLGRGNGSFIPQSIWQSGLYVPGDGKAIAKLAGVDSSYLVAVTQNRGPLLLLKAADVSHLVPFENGDRFAVLTMRNGRIRKEERYYGTSFLSQSSGFLAVNPSVKSVELVNAKGIKRKLF